MTNIFVCCIHFIYDLMVPRSYTTQTACHQSQAIKIKIIILITYEGRVRRAISPLPTPLFAFIRQWQSRVIFSFRFCFSASLTALAQPTAAASTSYNPYCRRSRYDFVFVFSFMICRYHRVIVVCLHGRVLCFTTVDLFIFGFENETCSRKRKTNTHAQL